LAMTVRSSASSR